METNLEIEFKILLNETLYNQMLMDYQDSIFHQYTQINYYLIHPLLDQKKYMLRIREKENRFELTLKQPVATDSLETSIVLPKEVANKILNKQEISNPIFEKLATMGILLKDMDTSHSLITLRIDVKLPQGLLSIDKNTYAGIVDYELELEVTNKEQGRIAFQQLLTAYDLSYQQNCPSKIKRLKQLL